MLAIFYMDNYLKTKVKVEISAILPIAFISLHIAIKVNDSDHIFSYEEGKRLINIDLKDDDFQKIEFAILKDLSFQLNIPTPIDFISYMLKLCNRETDFSAIIE